MNFDAGHFFGSTGIHPNTIIENITTGYSAYILRTRRGQALTLPIPIRYGDRERSDCRRVLKLIRDNKWPIYCDIELEYDIKPWSDAVKEVRNCVDYSRQILLYS